MKHYEFLCMIAHQYHISMLGFFGASRRVGSDADRDNLIGRELYNTRDDVKNAVDNFPMSIEIAK
jgi:hypothetical protein